jgi:acetoin utilization deacetylase AcuC-like enzyme
VKKVAVLDFDVHHGNGTEQGFRLKRLAGPEEDDPRHWQKEKEEKEGYVQKEGANESSNDDYRSSSSGSTSTSSSGSSSNGSEGKVEGPTLFYGSTHEKDNFPGTGLDRSPFVGDRSRRTVDRRIVNRALCRGPQSRQMFKEKWIEVLREMERFGPDLVIISAGFDAHDDDPLASVELEDEDFEWATDEILRSCQVINPSCPPPCLSVLEGGYDLSAIARSAVRHVRSLLQGPKREAYGGDEVAALQASLKEMGL